MKLRYAASVPLALISLFNVLVVQSPNDYPLPLTLLVTVIGIAGLIATVALVRDTTWGAPAAATVAAVNVVAAIIAVTTGEEGAEIGLVVSALALVAAAPLVFRCRPPAAQP